jgi:hypothetical protein
MHYDVLVASLLVSLLVVFLAVTLGNQAEYFTRWQEYSFKQNNALLHADRMIKTCDGLLKCESNLAFDRVLDAQKLDSLNSSGETCISRVALLDDELTVVKICS